MFAGREFASPSWLGRVAEVWLKPSPKMNVSPEGHRACAGLNFEQGSGMAAVKTGTPQAPLHGASTSNDDTAESERNIDHRTRFRFSPRPT